MGFWSKINPFSKAPDGQSISAATVDVIAGSLRKRHNRRSVQEVLAAMETSPWFRSVVWRISYAAAIVPWRIFAVKSARGTRDFDLGHEYCKHVALQSGESLEVRSRIKGALQQDGRLVEITDHVFLDLMADPCKSLTGVDSRLLTFAMLNAVGEVGWALEKNGQGAPVGYWPVPPHWIVEVPTNNDPHYTIQIRGGRRKIPEDEFVLYKNPTLVNPYGRGSGLGMSLADELETDEYISKFQNTWFHSRGKPDLVVTVKGATGGDPSQLARAKEQFENQYRDSTRGGRSMWVHGDVSVKELSQKLVDLDLAAQRTWIKDLAREVFGAPPEVMGDVKDSNRATVQEAMAILAMLSTIPQLERMRAQIQQKLIPLYDDRLVVDYWSPLPDNKEFALRALQAMPWAATRGEIRRMQGLEDRGQYDNVHMLPMNLIEVEGPALPKEHKGVTIHKLVQKTPLTELEIEEVLASLVPDHLDYELTPEVKRIIEAWGAKTSAELGLAPSFDLLNPRVVEYIDGFSGQKVVGINDTSKRLLRSTLRAGVIGGEGAEDIARRVSNAFDSFADTRALAIARTEVTSAANFGTYMAHSASGVVEEREWIATMDGLARDTHAGLDGAKVGIDESFTSSSGARTRYPGGFGIAAEDVNCRCITVAVIKDPEKSMTHEDRLAVWKSFVAETDKDEERVASAARRAFRAQEEKVLAKLREVMG